MSFFIYAFSLTERSFDRCKNRRERGFHIHSNAKAAEPMMFSHALAKRRARQTLPNFYHCSLNLRANKLRSRIAATKTNDATHNTSSISRRYAAVGNEMPIPVARAT
jgi:hypothetical protein